MLRVGRGSLVVVDDVQRHVPDLTIDGADMLGPCAGPDRCSQPTRYSRYIHERRRGHPTVGTRREDSEHEKHDWRDDRCRRAVTWAIYATVCNNERYGLTPQEV